jgi:hypothetical protein
VLIGGAIVVLLVGAGIGWLWAALHAWLITRAITLLMRFRGNTWQVTGTNRR